MIKEKQLKQYHCMICNIFHIFFISLKLLASRKLFIDFFFTNVI